MSNRFDGRGFAKYLRGLLYSVATVGLWSGASLAFNLPALPIALDSTYTVQSGRTIDVAPGASLQSAIDSAQLGDTLVLQAGATYRGPITLKNKTTGSGWIYIQSSAYSSLPAPGNRVSPSDAVNMPKITAGKVDAGIVFTADAAHHYRFVGIEIAALTGEFVYAAVTLGNDDTTLATLPKYYTFDRCYIHGDSTAGARRGISANASHVSVVDSYISDFKETGADTQAVWGYNTPGPIKIVNNYLEAAGENIMFGGAEPRNVAFIPADIEVRGNTLSKPMAWIGSWQIKNLLELKLGIRVLISQNRFSNTWAQNQGGFALVITPRNEWNTFPQAVVKDVTIVGNSFANIAQGVAISGKDDGDNVPGRTSEVTYRVLIRDNTFQLTQLAAPGLYSDGRLFQISNGPVDLTIDHNTGFMSTQRGSAMVGVFGTALNDRLTFTNNIFFNGNASWFGDLYSTAKAILANLLTNSTFRNNAIVDIALGNYDETQFPDGNFFPASTTAVGFVDFASGNFRLQSDSPYVRKGLDGADLGANMDLVAVAANNSIRVAPAAPSAIAIQ